MKGFLEDLFQVRTRLGAKMFAKGRGELAQAGVAYGICNFSDIHFTFFQELQG